jgi:hypothetical protein
MCCVALAAEDDLPKSIGNEAAFSTVKCSPALATTSQGASTHAAGAVMILPRVPRRAKS